MCIRDRAGAAGDRGPAVAAGQGAGGRVVGVDRDRAVQLVGHVGVRRRGMEDHVPGTGARHGADLGDRPQRAALRVEPVRVHLVGAQVHGEDVGALGVGDDLVRVRALLAAGVGAGAGVLHQARTRAHAAVGVDGVRGDAAGAVVRAEQVAAARVDREVGDVGAAGGPRLAQRGQGAVRTDREGPYRTLPSAVVQRVEHLPAGPRREEGGVGHRREAALPGQGAGRGVVRAGDDAVAVRAQEHRARGGVAASSGGRLLGRRGGRVGAERGGAQQPDERTAAEAGAASGVLGVFRGMWGHGGHLSTPDTE